MEASSFAEAGVPSVQAEFADERRGSDWPLVALFLGGVPVLYAAVGFGLYELFAFVS
jgi:hypothetical protein